MLVSMIDGLIAALPAEHISFIGYRPHGLIVLVAKRHKGFAAVDVSGVCWLVYDGASSPRLSCIG